ncbi:MAG: hypothetical protein A3A86_04540 [Elusimicrobia bacterium RIFCSPLOWO2_01_FULL_60_11]|nr:MAG: hypothetical protein A3A86_04540 [Elusimicrobia bacterium RIFCSPLOWO2_01_FULL_60_11]
MKKIKFVLAVLLASCALSSRAFAGWHFGESKDLGVNIEYFDYVELLPDGTPVYFLGTDMRYQVTLTNEGNRTFNNFQSKAVVKWADDYTCQLWWLDNRTVSYVKDAPLPGASDSGLRPAGMRKGEQSNFMATYPIPMDLCLGDAYLEIQGRHRNSSGKEETASFAIPLKARFKRR